MTSRAPGRRVAHYNQRIPNAGGTLGDSRAGSRRANRAGYRWIDNNFHLTAELHWVNAHGSPFNPQGLVRLGGKFENHKAATLAAAIPGLRSARQAFRQNARLGLSTEAEIKDLHPRASDADLEVAFRRLAVAARLAYGGRWQQRVQVKVLTNLSGGVPYARKVCRHAHAAGFSTIILPRKGARLRRLRGPAITYNRGGFC